MTQGELARPCVRCRKLHQRCDKKKPSCSTCEDRGIQCSYKHKKQLRFKTVDIAKMYVSRHEDSLNRVTQVRKHTDIACDTVIGYTIVMTAEKMKMLLQYNEDISTNQETTTTATTSELVLMFSVQGINY
jgi:carboxypeptidase C (cathepsin A)